MTTTIEKYFGNTSQTASLGFSKKLENRGLVALPQFYILMYPVAKLPKQKGDDIMAKEFKLSAGRLKELQDELHYLKTVREKEVAEQIKEARSFGDLSENSEYDEAKNEQGKLYSRIAEVENILANHVIIEETFSTDTVTLGCSVTVLDMEMDEEIKYKLVGSQEADPMNGTMSEDSPFGRALLGRKIGEIAKFEAPAGVQSYKILKVSN